MGAASSQAYASSESEHKKLAVNTNIFLINFQFISDKLYAPFNGNLPRCQKCSAYFNKYSSENLVQYADLMNQGNQKKQNLIQKVSQDYKQNLKELLQEPNTSIWVCDFCNFPNVIEGNMNNIITNEFIQIENFFSKLNEEKVNKKHADEMLNENPPVYSGEQLIYVLDNSGSMSSVESYKKHGEVVSLSRKNSIISSIQEQSTAFIDANEQKDISLVIFSDEVDLFTNLNSPPQKINGGCLTGWDQLVARCSGLQEQMVGVPANQIDFLLSIYKKSNKMGSTALGPAALAAVEVAKSTRGSQVIICTDGMANTGMGSIQNNKNSETSKFYTNLANYAKDKGVQISILGIGDDQMGFKEIGKLAEKTNGSVFKIDLSNLNSKLDNILSDKMIASDVKLRLYLHKNVKLDEQSSEELEVDVGNASKESCMTFEYLFKNANEMADLDAVPFQAQIEYTDLNGLRQFIIVTKSIKLTKDRKEIENNLNINVVEKRMAQKSANLIQQGDTKNANQYQEQWNNFIENNSNYQAYVPQLQQQQQMVQQLAYEGQSENAQVKLQQMQKGKFWN